MQQVGTALERSKGGSGGSGQAREVNRGKVGERIVLGVAPEEFDGVEFGRIRRQQFDVNARLPGQKGLDRAPAMGFQPIPHQDDRRGELTPELAQEGDEERPIDVGVRTQTETTP